VGVFYYICIMSAKDIFTSVEFQDLIKSKLPKLFEIAEVESTRGGKIGMEVGILRERVLTSFFISKVGEDNVDSDSSATENSKDVQVNGDDISIKTFTGSGYSGVKIFWTSDTESAKRVMDTYTPKFDLIVANINWGSNKGGLYYVDKQTQRQVMDSVGRDKFLKISSGSNNRGITYGTDVLKKLLNHENTLKIEIDWVKTNEKFNIFERWVKLINE
jgi:hypothetical protein